MPDTDPFPTIGKLAKEVGAIWPGYEQAARGTVEADTKLREALGSDTDFRRLLPADASLVLFGSFARHEMLEDSDYDWALLIDGVVDNQHSELSRGIEKALKEKSLKSPGTSGTFGRMMFSHDLVHRIGGGADSNENLTRRMLMLLESQSVGFSHGDTSDAVWENVIGNILERYFEEDVHFDAKKGRQVPRFLLNDLTRYWRTICVDYAAKYREQDGRKWAIRNAKLRFSRKLLYASGLAFCLSCQLDPQDNRHPNLFDMPPEGMTGPFVNRARAFSRTPALEYLAAFVDSFVANHDRKKLIAERIFGSYNWWLQKVGDKACRQGLETLDHADVEANQLFQEVRQKSSVFAKGLELLFFNRDRETEKDDIAELVLQYIGF